MREAGIGRQGERITWVGIGADLFLAFIKLAAGWLGRSQALVADGIHSLSDLVTDFVTLVALGLGRKPRDLDHPYGHGKIEDLATLSIGVVLVLVAVGMAVRAVQTFLAGEFPERSIWLPAAALLSILVKEWLYWATRRVGQQIHSPTLLANAWHHRSDALSSVAVLVGVGIYTLWPRLIWADMVAAFFVSGFVLRAGVRIFVDSVRDLVDTAPGGRKVDEIEAFARRVPGVLGVRRLRGRYYAQRIALDLDIEVKAQLSVQQGHDIAQNVEEAILAEFPEVYHVMTHVEPGDTEDGRAG